MSNSRSLGSVNELQARFKRQFELDQQFRVEDLLDSSIPSSTFSAQDLAELIGLEIKLRQSAGQSLDRYEYFDRFDGQVGVILKEFQGHSTENFACYSSMSNVDGSQHVSNVTDSKYVDEIPDKIGNYELKEKLGAGSFGVVFRAINTANGSEVALKFPRARVLRTPEQLRLFYQEAEASRSMEHPGIVRTLNVEDIDGYLFLVQHYIEGNDLHSFRECKTDTKTIIQVLAQVAVALAYAHQRGYLHRDLKPSNILLDKAGKPFIADFGLAVHESSQRRTKGQRCGSIDYMSPELVQGLSHQLDSRSDIWSLGVIMYYLLTGRKPFYGDTTEEVYDEIKNLDARPVRMLNPEIDVELQRICLRCLNKRKIERYATADELAADLTAWLESPSHFRMDAPMVPKGIRSFDADDSDFFVRLLPGPTDRHGFPASIRFWKSRIERVSGDVVPVGVIFGSSGCGKSSFIKAGLLPNIADSVIRIYVESTAADTEIRLLRAIRSRFPEISEELSLPDTVRALKIVIQESSGVKVLIVLDQFEQWLHAASKEQETQLIEAIRICDGVSVQCILTVRDDFWVKISSFISQLDVSLKENENLLRIDRFTIRHARKILAEFGRAYECLPTDFAQLDNDQNLFLDEAIEQLAEEDRVTCVRLALLAEMFRDREWTRAELRRVGGVSGIGETYLQETFAGKDAKPEYRRFNQPVQEVLESLLPPVGQEIRDHMRSRMELFDCLSNSSQADFSSVLSILNSDTSLIAPTDPGAGNEPNLENRNNRPSEYFQLTHDYMVSSVRTWLNRKKRETWQGRARLRLDELADHFQRSRDPKFVPSLDELARIKLAIPLKQRNAAHRELLSIATNRHGVRLAMVGLFLFIVLGAFAFLFRSNRAEQASAALAKYLECPSHLADQELQRLKTYSSLVTEGLQQAAQQSIQPRRSRAMVAMHSFYGKNEELLTQLVSELRTIPKAKLDRFEFENIVSSFEMFRDDSTQKLQDQFRIEKSKPLRARLALASLILNDNQPAKDLLDDVKDPTASTLLIHLIPEYWPRDRSLAEVATQTSDDLLFALLIAAGEFDRAGTPEHEKQYWDEILQDQFITNPRAGIHSACQYLARKWDASLDNPATRSKPLPGFDWWVVDLTNDCTMTFARVSPGRFNRGMNARKDFIYKQLPHVPIDITEEFWIASTELTIELVNEWLDSPSGADVLKDISRGSRQNVFKKQHGSLPAVELKFVEYQKLVDWLNQHSILEGYKFQIPDLDQWEYACRAGADTTFYWGDLTVGEYFEKYGVYVNFRFQEIIELLELPGSRIPNRWGLLDIVGNASELTLSIDETTNSVYSRGGNATDHSHFVSGNNLWNVPSNVFNGNWNIRIIIKKN